jgi:hypothetical protein
MKPPPAIPRPAGPSSESTLDYNTRHLTFSAINTREGISPRSEMEGWE